MPESMRLRLDDNDRELQMERARELLGIEKQRWKADVVDAALDHLLESHENIERARERHPPEVIQDIANTSVLGLRYRTSVESKWR